ncbi:MAG: hypothetical protein LV473_21915 [Nitrospira sp.]|nr:hypothetical protein [Nitrospira sp.]
MNGYTEGEGEKVYLPVYCASRCSLDGKLDKLLDIFCATTAAAALLQAKL